MSGIYPAMPAARIWLLTMGLLLLVAALLLPLTPSKRHFVTGDPRGGLASVIGPG